MCFSKLFIVYSTVPFSMPFLQGQCYLSHTGHPKFVFCFCFFKCCINNITRGFCMVLIVGHNSGFNYDLDKSTTHPKFNRTRIQTHDLLIMTVHMQPLGHRGHQKECTATLSLRSEVKKKTRTLK